MDTIHPILAPLGIWDNMGVILDCLASVAKYLLIGACSGALGLPILVATVPFLLGFTVGGVTAGSLAALMMTCHAGYIPVGGFVAMMQSLGTMGLAAGFNAITVVIGCLSGMALGGYLALFRDHDDDDLLTLVDILTSSTREISLEDVKIVDKILVADHIRPFVTPLVPRANKLRNMNYMTYMHFYERTTLFERDPEIYKVATQKMDFTLLADLVTSGYCPNLTYLGIWDFGFLDIKKSKAVVDHATSPLWKICHVLTSVELSFTRRHLNYRDQLFQDSPPYMRDPFITT
ncbi:hypothetical protein BGZ83_010729 [Gryganskiella cystojenkinii]|nr:hypothetical protein BGZ83_010729 [Gryganskiella cystojenkinii]